MHDNMVHTCFIQAWLFHTQTQKCKFKVYAQIRWSETNWHFQISVTQQLL